MQTPRRTVTPKRQVSPNTLTHEERTAIEQGRLFKLLSPDMQQAVLGRAYVRRLADGQVVLPANGPVDHWLGVASGELVGFSVSLETGERVASLVASPGAWLTYYSPLCEVRQRDVEFVAGGPTCLVALSRADMTDLFERGSELSMALLRNLVLNLRFVLLMVQEFQTATLEQKLLRWINGSAHSNAGAADGRMVYRSAASQASLAAAAGVSRQTWNAGMARLEASGLIQRVKGGMLVPDTARLDAEMERHGLRDTMACIEQPPGPDGVPPASALPCEPLPIGSLRDDERAALDGMRWFRRLSAPVREAVLGAMQVLRPRNGDQLGHAGHLPWGWLCVLRGSVRVTCTPLARAAQSGGAEAPATAPVRTVLAQLQPGATFFEYALIDGGACGEDAFAEAETTLLLLSPQAFRALLEAHAELRLGVLKWMAYGRHQLSVLKLILALPMPLRLHAWLDMLGRQRGQRQDTWLAIPMTLNQQEIAGWLGTTRQYVARAIAGLEGDGRLVRRCDTWLLRRDALPLAAAPALSSADS